MCVVGRSRPIDGVRVAVGRPAGRRQSARGSPPPPPPPPLCSGLQTVRREVGRRDGQWCPADGSAECGPVYGACSEKSRDRGGESDGRVMTERCGAAAAGDSG